MLAQESFNTEQQNDQDPEQQQLEWCFTYSNLLGYDIDYIINPRLFQSIGEWIGTPYKYSGETEKESIVLDLYAGWWRILTIFYYLKCQRHL